MTSFSFALGGNDVFHGSASGCVRHHKPGSVRFIDNRRLVIASLMCAWLTALLWRFRCSAPATPIPAGSGAAAAALRPVIGIFLAVAGVFVGWVYSPTAALLIFRFTLGYDAWISRIRHC